MLYVLYRKNKVFYFVKKIKVVTKYKIQDWFTLDKFWKVFILYKSSSYSLSSKSDIYSSILIFLKVPNYFKQSSTEYQPLFQISKQFKKAFSDLFKVIISYSSTKILISLGINFEKELEIFNKNLALLTSIQHITLIFLR